MIKAYTDAGRGRCLIGPYVAIAVWIDPDSRELVSYIIQKYLYDYELGVGRIRDLLPTRMFTTLGGLNRMVDLHKKNCITAPFLISTYTVFAPEINLRGIDCAIDYANRRAVLDLRAQLIAIHDLFRVPYEIILSQDNLNTPEGLLCYLYSSILRYNWFRVYNYYYEDLRLVVNWGNDTEQHLKELMELMYLPEFYIWERAKSAVNRYMTKNRIDNFPNWYKKEKESYECFSQYDDKAYALRL